MTVVSTGLRAGPAHGSRALQPWTPTRRAQGLPQPWILPGRGLWLPVAPGRADDTYEIRLCFYETPFCPTIICRFAEDRLTYDFKPNVGFRAFGASTTGGATAIVVAQASGLRLRCRHEADGV